MKINKKILYIVVLFLVLVEFSMVFLCVKSYSNKNIVEKKEEAKVDKEIFTMYVENESGEYEKYNDSNHFPGMRYKLNEQDSYCTDIKGNKTDATFYYDESKVTITSSKTLFCHLYFDNILVEPVKFDYTGDVQTYQVTQSGYYELEVWGAEGGTGMADGKATDGGGYGSYSRGSIYLNKGQTLYVYIGGQGTNAKDQKAGGAGGYNGGGDGGIDSNYSSSGGNEPGAGGGGATHIATTSGLLSELSEKTSEILIVAGGGGGGGYDGMGGHAGGYIGSIGETDLSESTIVSGGSQDSGYAFGLGQSGTSLSGGTGGGGGGWYGGITPTTDSGGTGSGGSGYIGNNNLLDKLMYCYECEESEAENTKTISGLKVSDNPIENYAKSGNGYAKITYIPSGILLENTSSTLNTITVKVSSLNSNKSIDKYYYKINDGIVIESDNDTYTFSSIRYEGSYSSTALTADTEYVITVYVKYTDGMLSENKSNIFKTSNYLGEYLLANPTSGLNTELLGEMYRYQGTNGNVDNYVCFGTNEMDLCLNNPDRYLYRIIGVNENNQVQLLKVTSINSATEWGTGTPTWATSSLYSYLNSASYLYNSNYIPESWKGTLIKYNWKYGDLTTYNVVASSLYNSVSAWTESQSAYVGMLQMHDYYFSNGDLNCYGTTNCLNSWMHISNNGNTTESEWTMTRNNTTKAWGILQTGKVASSAFSQTTGFAVRPSIFLDNNIYFTRGNGTIEKPFMLGGASEFFIGGSDNPTYTNTLKPSVYFYVNLGEPYGWFDLCINNSSSSSNCAWKGGISQSGQLGTITLPSGDGEKTVYLHAKLSGETLRLSDTIILDTTKPIINAVNEVEVTSNSIKVEVDATDTNGIKKYYYSINDEEYISSNSNTYTFTNLNRSTTYNIKVYVVDMAGNESAVKSTTFKTADNMVIFYQGVWDKTITPKYTGYYEGSAGVSGNNIKLNIYWGHFSGGQVSFSFDATGFTTYTVNLSATDGKPPITVKVGSVSKTVYTSSSTTVVLDISSLSGMQSCLIKYANGEYNNGTDSAYISKIEAT